MDTPNSPSGFPQGSDAGTDPQPAGTKIEGGQKPSAVFTLLLPAISCVVLVTCCLISRPPLPPDETRYLTVAWEMKERGDYLVPHLNGETYAHKPPLLFWLMNVAWLLFGKSLLAARCIAPLAGIATVLLSARLAKDLWPGLSANRRVPWVLASTMLWMFFSPVTMFDTLLSLWTVSALFGMRMIVQQKYLRGLWVAGISLGLGILSKGPVILVHVLPAALLFPVWNRHGNQPKSTAATYLTMLGAVGIGAIIALSWALPAAWAGGEAFANELLFGQTAGRMLNSFAHRQPFWWYLPWLPLCVMPWMLTSGVRNGLWSLRAVVTKGTNAPDDGTRFVLCWGLGSVLILSFVSGKQIYYLMPAVPAFALAVSRWLEDWPMESMDLKIVGASTVLTALLPVIVNHVAPFSTWPVAGMIPDIWCLPMVVCGAIVPLLSSCRKETAVAGVSMAAVGFVSCLVMSFEHTVWAGFDVRPLGESLRDRTEDLAWYGNYHGQLNIPAVRSHVEELITPEDAELWLREHPGGLIVIRAASLSQASRARIRTWTLTSGAVDGNQLEATLRLAMEECDLPAELLSPVCVDARWIRRGLSEDLHLVCKFSQQK